jgi:hypothetical protein
MDFVVPVVAFEVCLKGYWAWGPMGEFPETYEWAP